jgi:hypothetical protein
MVASFQFISPGFPFRASAGWVKDFKKNTKLDRHVTKYISSRDNMTFEETIKAAELFQKLTVAVVPDFYLDYAINSYQTGCEYRVNIRKKQQKS